MSDITPNVESTTERSRNIINGEWPPLSRVLMGCCFRIIFFAALLSPIVVNAQQYRVIDLGTLGGANSDGLGINGSGQVSGEAQIAGNVSRHAFVTNSINNYMVDLGTLGGRDSTGAAINSSGQVTGGSYLLGDLVRHAFVTNATTNAMKDLGTLGGTQSFGCDINSIGQVTGYSNIFGDVKSHAFITHPASGQMLDLGTLGGSDSWARSINAIGQVTGYSSTSKDLAVHAFVTNSNTNTMIDLGTLGGTSSYGLGINSAGQVVGYSSIAGDAVVHAFITDGLTGQMIDLGTLTGGTASVASGVNSTGEVVGWSNGDGIQNLHGFIYKNGKMNDLNDLLVSSQKGFYTIYVGNRINDRGQIVAWGVINESGAYRAFLLIPVVLTVVHSVSGVLGTNGWYVGNSAISWVITGTPTPTTSGCGPTTVTADTAGVSFTCTATNPVDSASQTVTIKQDTTAPSLSISAPVEGTTYGVSAVVPANFTCTDATSGIAACVGTVVKGVSFDTATVGTKTFIASATDNAGNITSRTVSYTVAAGYDNGLTTNRGNVVFPSQQVLTSSLAGPITLSNSGSTSIGLRSITLGGANGSMFSRSTTCGSVLAAGATCSINVFFRPTTMGAKSGSLIVTTTLGGAKTVPLSGSGLAPPLTLSTVSVAFGGQLQGSLSAAKQLGITNNWSEQVRLTSLTISGMDGASFSRSTTCGAILAPGSFCTASVSFRPGSPGDKTAQLNIASQAAASPQVVALTGTGTFLQMSATPTALDFGFQPVGTVGTARVVTVTNSGTQGLRLTAVAITGVDATSYSRSTTCGAALAVGASCDVRVFFKPTAGGARAANLTISATGVAAKVVSLTGAGI